MAHVLHWNATLVQTLWRKTKQSLKPWPQSTLWFRQDNPITHQSLCLYIHLSALLASDQFFQRPVRKLTSARSIRQAYCKSLGQSFNQSYCPPLPQIRCFPQSVSQSVSKTSPISHSNLVSPGKSNNLSVSQSVGETVFQRSMFSRTVRLDRNISK